MSTVSGACSVKNVSGMLHILEEVTPSVLEWKAIDQLKIVTIALNKLKKLQAPKESSNKLMLRILYDQDGEEKDLRLSFTNRPTMNNIKESLQTIIARLKTIIKDSPTPAIASPAPNQTPSATSPPKTAASSNDMMLFTNPDSLSDASLLKNHQLQQKYLLEDKNLRNIFTQSVIKFKLSPNVFWSTRLNQLRTYALTISQHRGPYNVLSTIKPVATSDNQVNVNVTRDTINEIFDTYPIVKRAFDDLVPAKASEGEFWSRFFNSKLFRRLRGDKINTINTRGDVVLDKYLYIDVNYLDTEEKPNENNEENTEVKKIIDLRANQDDNSQKLGNKPDITMRFLDDTDKTTKVKSKGPGQENEMIILMKNMNKLSSKIISMNSILEANTVNNIPKRGGSSELSPNEIDEFEEELNLNDLNDHEELKYIQLNISNNINYENPVLDIKDDVSTTSITNTPIEDIKQYYKNCGFYQNSINLNDIYQNKENVIDKSVSDFITITKHNSKIYKIINNFKDSNQLNFQNNNNIINDSIYQQLITFNITIMEFLSHFWSIFLNGNNPIQLKKIFASLRQCKSNLNELIDNIIKIFNSNDAINKNEKLKDKLIKDLDTCVFPLQQGLDKAINDYVKAVKALDNDTSDEINENGKRVLN